MSLIAFFAALSAVPSILAQNVTVPSTCSGSFSPGSDTVLYTVPYTYDQVLSIIGKYQNITWMGVPSNAVALNGTTDTVGTARTYDLLGAHVIETITYYSKPAAPGPYQEIHTAALLSVPSFNVSLYIPYDGTIVSSVCDGQASQFNFTAHFCASNAITGAQVLHTVHQNAAATVGAFLGGRNYTGCAAAPGPASNSTSSSGPGNVTGPAPNGTWTGMPGGKTSPSSNVTVAGSNQAVKYVAGPLAGVVAIFAGVLML